MRLIVFYFSEYYERLYPQRVKSETRVTRSWRKSVQHRYNVRLAYYTVIERINSAPRLSLEEKLTREYVCAAENTQLVLFAVRAITRGLVMYDRDLRHLRVSAPGNIWPRFRRLPRNNRKVCMYFVPRAPVGSQFGRWYHLPARGPEAKVETPERFWTRRCIVVVMIYRQHRFPFEQDKNGLQSVPFVNPSLKGSCLLSPSSFFTNRLTLPLCSQKLTCCLPRREFRTRVPIINATGKKEDDLGLTEGCAAPSSFPVDYPDPVIPL